MKKLISIIFALGVMLCAVSAYAEIVGGSCGDMGDNVKWSLDTDACVLTISGEGRMQDFVEIEYMGAADVPVGPPWAMMFGGGLDKYVKTVIIEDGVTYIGGRSFYYCSDIESITVPDYITNIGDIGLYAGKLKPENWENGGLYLGHVLYAVKNDEITDTFVVKEGTERMVARFKTNVLKKLILPEGLKYIGERAFSDFLSGGCKALAEIVFPDSLEAIGDYAFSGCESLTAIELPASIRTIGSRAFENCTSLAEIVLPAGFYGFTGNSFENTAYYNNEENWQGGVLVLNGCIVTANSDISAEYTVAGDVTAIAGEAFQFNRRLEKIVIPENVKGIGAGAFEHCGSLREAVLPEGLVEISGLMFNGCENLERVNIPSTVRRIGVSAFGFCDSLAEISFPAGLEAIGGRAFSSCRNLREVILPEGLTEIRNGVFSGCRGLEKAVIPSTVREIGDYAFYECPNLVIHIPDSVERIGLSAFDTPWYGFYGSSVYSSTILCGPQGSYAEQYAKAHSIKFVPTAFEVMVAEDDLYIDGERIEHRGTEYPLLIYGEVTYFPLSFENILGLGLAPTVSDGEFRIDYDPSHGDHPFAQGNSDTLQYGIRTAVPPGYAVFINGTEIDNTMEDYPLLNFGGVTYVPLTQRFAAELHLAVEKDDALRISTNVEYGME